MHYEPRVEPTDFTVDMECRGIVFDIQRYTVHDGPGTRTSVFLKGCPLKCLWCCNPESQNMRPEVGVHPARCIGVDKCGLCLTACPLDAKDLFIINDEKQVAGINRDLCTNCLACVEACPADSLTVMGKEMSVAEVLEEILKDRDFFKETGGGVTISGGEAFSQPKFTFELLKACKKEKIHTCVESSLHVPWDVVEEALPFIDFFITDIKNMDPDQYFAQTGGKLELVKENIQKLARAYRETIIRIPFIPGHNDSPDNIRKTSLLIDEEFGINLQQVQVLQFHELGKGKYAALNKPYPLADMLKPEREAYVDALKEAVAIIKEQGLPGYVDSKISMTR